MKACIFCKTNLIFFLTIILIVSCSEWSQNANKNLYRVKIDKYSLKFNEKINEIDLFSAKEYFDSVYIIIRPLSYDALYRLVLYNDTLELLDTIQLPPFYRNQDKGFVNSICFASKDSLLIFQDHCISIYNLKSRRIDFEFVHSYEDTSLFFYQTINQDIVYNPYTKSFRTGFVRFDDLKNRQYEADTEFAIEVSILDKKLRILAAKYPKVFSTDKRFLPNAQMYVANNEEYYFACSGIDNEILRWRIDRNNTVEIFDLRHPSFRDPLSLAAADYEKKDHLNRKLVRTFAYSGLFFDEKNNVFWRIFEKEMPEYKNSLKTIYSDKNIGVNIFNDNFTINEEVIIGKIEDVSLGLNFFPTNKGIITYLGFTDNELSIGVLNLVKK